MDSQNQTLRKMEQGSRRNGHGTASSPLSSARRASAAPLSRLRRLRRKMGGLVAYSVSWYRY